VKYKKNEIPVTNNKGNWNNLKIIQKIPEQQTGKARSQELQKTILGTAHTLRKVLM
jgi:hypothetical protein